MENNKMNGKIRADDSQVILDNKVLKYYDGHTSIEEIRSIIAHIE